MKCKDFKSLNTVYVIREDQKEDELLTEGEDFKVHEEESKHFLHVTKKLANKKHHFRINIQNNENKLHDWTTICFQKGIYPHL